MPDNIHTLVKQVDLLAAHFDGEGFLVNQDDWSTTLAHQLARDAGIDQLTESHWRVIRYLRDYHERLGFMPPASRVCRQLGMEKFDIKELFGSCLGVWRISGLPNPGPEAIAYLS